MKKAGLVLVLALTAAIGQGGSKERAWQEGMLLNPEQNAYFKGVEKTETLGGGAFRAASDRDISTGPGLSVRDHYVLDGGDSAYLLERVHLSSSPNAKVFITMQVKFFVDKSKLYMLDRDGKEVEMKIVKQARKGGLVAGQ
jgi:hypothetical protein